MLQTPVDSHRKYIDFSITGVRYCGILNFDSSAANYKKRIAVTIRTFSLILECIYCLGMVADMLVNYYDIEIVIDDGCFFIGAVVVVIKLFQFYKLQDQVYELLDKIHNPIDSLRQSNDSGVLAIIKEAKLFEVLDFYLFSVVGFTLALGMVLIVPVYKGQLPSRVWYPFDYWSSPFYQAVYFMEAYVASFNITTVVFVEFLGIGLLRWTTVQMKVLSANYRNCNTRLYNIGSFDISKDVHEKIEKLNLLNIEDQDREIYKFIAFDDKEVDNMEDSFKWRFKTCIKHHKRLIKIVQLLNDTLSINLMNQLGSSIFIMCLNGYLVVMLSYDAGRLIRSVIYLITGLVQLIYWCGFSNELKFQADRLTVSQWISGWEDHYSNDIKTLVTTAMIKTMQPLEMRAGGLFVLTLETFISIVKTSYSVFLLLTSVSEEEP